MSIFGLLFTFCLAAFSKSQYSVQSEITLRSQVRGVLKIEVNLAPGSVIAFDRSNRTGSMDYDHFGDIRRSRSGWIYSIQVISMSNGHGRPDSLNRKKLFMSETHLNDVSEVRGPGGSSGGQPSDIRNGLTQVHLSLANNLREMRQVRGTRALTTIMEVPQGTKLSVDKRKYVRQAFYQSATGEVKRSRRGWYHGVKIASIPGMSASRINQLNSRNLYISEEIFDAVGSGRGGRGGTASGSAPPLVSAGRIAACSAPIGGSWSFARAPRGCTVPKVSYVQRNYSNLIYTTDLNSYVRSMNRFIDQAARNYYRKRGGNNSLLNTWVRAVKATAHQETYWTHYRRHSGTVKYMRGDRGHGHGMMQVDDRSHRSALNRGAGWDLQTNLTYAMDVLYRGWQSRASCVSGALSRARQAYSIFNGGAGASCRWTRPGQRWSKNDRGFLQKWNQRKWRNF